MFAHVTLGELGRAINGVIRDRHLVMLLEAVLEAEEDLHRVGHRRLVHYDLLKAAEQRCILLDDLELVEGGGADDADVAFLEDGLHHVRQVQGASAGGAGADHGVDLIDEENGFGPLLERRDHLLEALLEVATVPGAREHGARVEGEDLGTFQELGGIVAQQGLSQAVDDGGLAHAGVAHEHRIVLATPAEDLEHATHFLLAADERVEQALARPFRERRCERFERIAREG